jgi:hypothetical protein
VPGVFVAVVIVIVATRNEIGWVAGGKRFKPWAF